MITTGSSWRPSRKRTRRGSRAAVILGALLLTAAGSLPAVAATDTTTSTDTAAQVDGELRFVGNIPYPAGTDIEFGEFEVPVLDEDGNPVCETDENGECRTDEEGNPVFLTELRDYAFAGSQNSGIRVVDITDPEDAFVAALIECDVNQADIQVRVDLGLLVVGVDTDTVQCGMGGSQGLLIFDVTDPRNPEQLSVFSWDRGAHNASFHPTEPLIYISDSDVANAGLGEIPVVDVADPAEPALVTTLAYHVHSPHDITFDSSGDRAYAASISHTDILDTTDPRDPQVISSIHDPAINIHHQADPTPDGQFLIIADELAGAAASPQCPGGGLHFYDISEETLPAKVGAFFADDTEQRPLCTSHVFRINPDGETLTIGWYSAGTRVVDITELAGLGASEIAHLIPSGLGDNPDDANSWASKMWKDGYIYSNDRNRGLDIMRLIPADGA